MPIHSGFYYAESNLAKNQRIPVVLIHGAGSDHLCWPAELRRLNGERVLALDLPGHGRSAGVGQQSVEGYTRQLFEFLDSMNIYKAVLVGHSLGGCIALMSALQYPKRVVGLGLLACGARMKVPLELINLLSNRLFSSQIIDLLQTRLFSPATGSDLVERVMNGLKKVRPGTLQGDWQAVARFDICSDLGKIRTPAWIATGTDDQFTPLALAHYLAATIRNASLLTVQKAGHLLILEQPHLVSQGLVSFLSGLPMNG